MTPSTSRATRQPLPASSHQPACRLTPPPHTRPPARPSQANRIGTRGIAALADAAARGALRELSSLDLRRNYASEASANVLVEVCASGALPKLMTLHIGSRALFKQKPTPKPSLMPSSPTLPHRHPQHGTCPEAR